VSIGHHVDCTHTQGEGCFSAVVSKIKEIKTSTKKYVYILHNTYRIGHFI